MTNSVNLNFEDDPARSESSLSAFSEIPSVGSHESDAVPPVTAEELDIKDMTDDIAGSRLARHAKYFMKDGNVTFQVEDTLFRVHRFFFARDSEHFRAILGDEGPEADNDKDCVCSARSGAEPICLDDDGVSKVGFERFLDILYPSDFSAHSLSTVDEWTSILHLASKWRFATLRTLAIRALLPLAAPVDKIYLARTYDIPEWLHGAYTAICARDEVLTVAEGRRLGVDDTVQIAAIRQALRPCNAEISVDNLHRAVTEALHGLPGSGTPVELDLDAATPEQATYSPEAPEEFLPTDVEEESAADGFHLVTRMILSQPCENVISDCQTNNLGLLPRIAAQVSEFDERDMGRLAQFLLDTTRSCPQSIDKYARICRYLMDHIDSIFGEPDRSFNLISGKMYFEMRLVSCIMSPCDRAVPNMHDVRLLLAAWPGRLPAGLVTTSLGDTVARLDRTNAKEICELLGLIVDAYHGVDRHLRDDIEALVFRVEEATRAMHWRCAFYGDALMQQWFRKRALYKRTSSVLGFQACTY